MADEKQDPRQQEKQAQQEQKQYEAERGVTEGELRALRSDAGLNLLAGHEGTLGQWENSDDGKKFLEEAEKRDTAEEEKTIEETSAQADEAVEKYREAVSGSSKKSSRSAK